MEPLITLNINRIVDQICAANNTNGLLTAENETLNAKNEELTKENHALRDELSAIKEELATQKTLWEYSYAEKEKYRQLYESLTKGEDEANG